MSYNQAFSQYRFDLAASIANIILLMTGVIGFFYVRHQIKERCLMTARSVSGNAPLKVHSGQYYRTTSLLKNLLVGLFMVFVVLFTLFPFYWMLKSSFQTPADILALPPVWFPLPVHAGCLYPGSHALPDPALPDQFTVCFLRDRAIGNRHWQARRPM